MTANFSVSEYSRTLSALVYFQDGKSDILMCSFLEFMIWRTDENYLLDHVETLRL